MCVLYVYVYIQYVYIKKETDAWISSKHPKNDQPGAWEYKSAVTAVAQASPPVESLNAVTMQSTKSPRFEPVVHGTLPEILFNDEGLKFQCHPFVFRNLKPFFPYLSLMIIESRTSMNFGGR